MAQFKCFDDPAAIFGKAFCVSALSKNLKGELRLENSKEQKCNVPKCRTLRTAHTLEAVIKPVPQCDSTTAKPIGGKLVAKLMTAFDTDGMHRGFHSGDFVMDFPAGVKVAGRMSGVTNVGTHRDPIQACQKCGDQGIMEGKLCGEVVDAGNTRLKGCQVIAAYRIKFDPSAGAITTGVVGTIEGVVVCFCTS